MSEKATNSLTKNFLIYGMGNMFYTAVILLLIPLYLERLSLADYGAFSVFYITGNLFSVIFSLSISNGILRFFSEFKEDKKQQIQAVSTMIGFFAIAFIGLFVIFYFSPAWLYDLLNKGGQKRQGLIIILVWSFARIYYNMILGVLRANNNPIKYVLLTMLDVAFLCIINFYIIFFTHYNLYSILFGYSIASLATVLLGFFFIAENLRVTFNIKIFKYLFNYGVPLSLANAAAYFTAYGNRYFLIYFTSSKNVAIYDVAQKITGVLGIILVNAFMIAFTPFYLDLYTTVDKDEFKRKVNEIILVFLNAFFFLGIGLILFDNYALDLLSKKEYLNSALYTPLLILANAFNILFMLLAMTTNINKRTSVELIITIFMLVAGILSNLALVNLYGLLGAAISQLITCIVGFVAINIYNKKYFPLDFNFKEASLIMGTFIIVACLDRFIEGVHYNFIYKMIFNILILGCVFYIYRSKWEFAIRFIKTVIKKK